MRLMRIPDPTMNADLPVLGVSLGLATGESGVPAPTGAMVSPAIKAASSFAFGESCSGFSGGIGGPALEESFIRKNRR